MALPVETFFLHPDAQGTLQQQIQQMIAQGILSGRFQQGEKLPSTRKLASHLGVSRITVTIAYTELLANDYLVSKGRSGYFVSENAPTPPSFTAPPESLDAVDWARAIGQKFSGGAGLAKPQDWAKFRFPFIYGQADQSLFDHANWRLCALQALGQKDFAALTTDYYDQDDPQLIEFIARHTLPRRGITARPEQILITLGAQNALWLTTQVLLTQRRNAVLEDPCYPALRDILSQSRCNVTPVRVDQDGLPPDAIPPETHVVFTTPSHQCPTNATMPMERRRALLDRAREMEALIVEDDYEFEMSFLKSPSPALKSLDTDGRVIYVGSFSKSLFPGLRLGYLVGSEPFIREARALRASVLRHAPGHIQRTASYFLSLGHYDALIRRMGTALHERRRIMEEALAAHDLRISGRGYFGGSSFWMRAPDQVNTDDLARRLHAKGVLIEPGRPFFAGSHQPANYYRLAYSSIPTARIREGVDLIAHEIAAT
ncbi:PLP-dependent aminotransferase family protein [Sulfitobacter sp. M57]|uniref:MocR-like pyridoxine biosynthesis transcription factor PdxR n=1 Tax=unclassified Sulfitobacter TaxID=196795 RepID=UPI0023E2E01A|nr:MULTISPECIES: PLP-dependent aminotransferase family protein [unclassified Sulfitobacter]MDF3414671.1 PLP-dependent aminotransferase family protein [Sulfitobacter sp. KE5]MDF3422152.1 PLP-dependent aminotransferase family protein [Sulfitobacter sp. KE43]MDF3433217.1 PLP-dependent aminotransferase family protein [Sulfitobacter sp. KE42]MDF3458857.1 PLP-dependent aminotransferase family protein [Sulfitobacter sp. S74]MDF3462756.1 PLP-dependent aminotransferase family protein [Sulfitobacter sp.